MRRFCGLGGESDFAVLVVGSRDFNVTVTPLLRTVADSAGENLHLALRVDVAGRFKAIATKPDYHPAIASTLNGAAQDVFRHVGTPVGFCENYTMHTLKNNPPIGELHF